MQLPVPYLVWGQGLQIPLVTIPCRQNKGSPGCGKSITQILFTKAVGTLQHQESWHSKHFDAPGQWCLQHSPEGCCVCECFPSVI